MGAGVRCWQPWRESTGLKTKAGKAICWVSRTKKCLESCKKRRGNGKNVARFDALVLALDSMTSCQIAFREHHAEAERGCPAEHQ